LLRAGIGVKQMTNSFTCEAEGQQKSGFFFTKTAEGDENRIQKITSRTLKQEVQVFR